MSPRVQEAIIALVAHARHVPVSEREEFASRLHPLLRTRSVILKTCHRVEAYTTSAYDDELSRLAGALPAGGRALTGDPAVRHAISVAVGRDSVVLGEDQVLHQLRESVEAARSLGALDPAIDRLFALALRAGRRARSWQHGRRRSLADVALEEVERRSGPVRGRAVLVIGAGRMGDLAARAAIAGGGAVTVASRTVERARALAEALGGQATELDPGPRVGRAVAVIVALSGPWRIGPATAEALVHGRAVVVDLSVPPAVPGGLAAELGGRLVTVDDLAHAEREDVGADRVLHLRSEELIEHTVREFTDWHARGDARAAADSLVRRADREREAELAALWRRLPTLEPEAREAIERMTRSLAARLLRQPLERLGRDSDGADGRAVRDLFAL